MSLVTALAIVTTVFVWATPSVLHRQLEGFQWRATLRAQLTSLWWACMSIVSFAGVIIGGRAFGLPGAAGFAALLLVLFVGVFYQRLGTTRKLQTLCAALATAPRETALPALEAELARHRERTEGRANGYPAWAQWTLHAAARASLAGYPEDALRLAEAIDPARIGRKVRFVYVQHVAMFRLVLGDRSGARALVAKSPRPAEPATMEQGFQAMEALFDALEGDAKAALARADRALGVPHEPTVKVTWQAVRAHALEGSGALAEARTFLRSMRAEHGDMPLRRIAAHAGPASAAAAAILAEAGPYR